MSWLHTFHLCILYLLISLYVHLFPFLCLSTHWLGQVTESCRIHQIQSLSRTDKSKRITFITLAPYNIYFQDKDVTVCGLTSDW